MSKLSKTESLQTIFTNKIILNLLKLGKFDVFLESLNGILTRYFNRFIDNRINIDSLKLNLIHVAPLLMSNLSSENGNLRLQTLEFFVQFPGILIHNSNKKCRAIEELLESERCGINFQELKTKTNSIHRVLDELQRNLSNTDKIYLQILSHYVMGGFFVK
jgi:hypothetical protein